MRRQAAILGLALLASCSKGESGGDPARTPPADGQSTARSAPDPTSPQAARDQVALYYQMIADKRFDPAQAMWSQGPIGTESPSLFAARFAGEEQVRAEVGQPSSTEGAAGSVYVTIPVIVRGVPAMAPDAPYELHRLVILRRVNAVPGSSPAQRQWHIHEVRDVAAEPEGTARPIAF